MIKSIKAREILDSRGWPTVEVDLETSNFLVKASVPSGTSKGKYEAVELRDGEKRYEGKGVSKAVKKINEIITPKLIGWDAKNQREIDKMLINLDGTSNKSNLGANSILAVSIACCRAAAREKSLPLYKYISQISDLVPAIPGPCFLLIEGGLHAGNDLSIQEFMINPEADSFKEKLEIGTEIYHTLSKILEQKYGKMATNVGLEGGFAAPLKKTKEVLSLISKAIKQAGYENRVRILIDVASSSFFDGANYQFEGKKFRKEKLLNFYKEILEKYPILGIEDPFSEDDLEGFRMITEKFGKKYLIVGDDLLVTNPERIKFARGKKACNAMILKPNQIGTVSEAIEAAKLAKSFGWKIIVSHRSGDTTDAFIADFGTGISADFIKTGAPTRGERVAKYNRLLEIEEEINLK
jgi:enolase